MTQANSQVNIYYAVLNVTLMIDPIIFIVFVRIYPVYSGHFGA